MIRQGVLLTAFAFCCASSIAAQVNSPAGPVPVERLTARRDGLARAMEPHDRVWRHILRHGAIVRLHAFTNAGTRGIIVLVVTPSC